MSYESQLGAIVDRANRLDSFIKDVREQLEAAEEDMKTLLDMIRNVRQQMETGNGGG